MIGPFAFHPQALVLCGVFGSVAMQGKRALERRRNRGSDKPSKARPFCADVFPPRGAADGGGAWRARLRRAWAAAATLAERAGQWMLWRLVLLYY